MTDTLTALRNYFDFIENLDKRDKNYNKILIKAKFQYFINRLQVLCDNYDYEKTSNFLNSVLYCLGEAINPGEYAFSAGFNRWKTVLISHLLKGMPHS